VSDRCIFCDAVVVKGEQHHFPLPKRHGGTRTELSCRNCHDLADRHLLQFEALPAFSSLWEKSSGYERIVPWKMHCLHLDAMTTLRATEPVPTTVDEPGRDD